MQTWTLITGASEGLGKEFARIAAADGRNLILTARSEDKLHALASELQSVAGEIVVIPADLNDPAATEALWNAATDNRHIEILINNAGLGRHGNFADADGWGPELTILNVNVTALTYLMKQAVPHMLHHGQGRIMNLASTAAFMAGRHMAVYHASKSYVLSLSEAVAEELRGSDVSVTAVCPGATQTAFFDVADMQGIHLLKLAPPMKARGVAQTGWNAMMARRAVVVTGVMNKLIVFCTRLAPRRLTTFLTARITAKGK